jgi:hypothetical protein
MFYTLTAPSRYHATHVHSGKRNDKYRNASPRKTQKYLCKVWSRVRAKWRRKASAHLVFVLPNRITTERHTGTCCYFSALKRWSLPLIFFMSTPSRKMEASRRS